MCTQNKQITSSFRPRNDTACLSLRGHEAISLFVTQNNRLLRHNNKIIYLRRKNYEKVPHLLFNQ